MPSLSAATGWLNTEPLSAAKLRGHVVVVNFWTLTCINWVRAEPYVRAWAQAYSADGLVMLGVHTPEFAFEYETERVRRAVTEHRIDYPVAIDNRYGVWSAFENHYWPALYFIDAHGVIRDVYFGEGGYERCERVIQKLLGIERELVSVAGNGVEAAPDWDNLRTPETYLGHWRSERFASPGGGALELLRCYELPEWLALNQWALRGDWTVQAESVLLGRAGGTIAFRFHARDVHLVLAAATGEPIAFRVRLDGQAPGAARGEDTACDGTGTLTDGRLYQLVRQNGDVQDRTVEITFLDPGAEAYAFTFG